MHIKIGSYVMLFFQGFEDKLKQKKEEKKRMGKTGGRSGTDESNSSTPQVRLIVINAKYLFLCLFILKSRVGPSSHKIQDYAPIRKFCLGQTPFESIHK